MIEEPQELGEPVDSGPDAMPSFRDQLELGEALRETESRSGDPNEPVPAQSRHRHSHPADAALVERLIATGLAGMEYDTFITELARYGLVVMTAWTLDGTAFARAQKMGRPVALRHRPTMPRIRRDDAVAIADINVTLGLRLFQNKVFGQRVWQPEGGASIKTFFIGGCLLTLSNACRMWRPDAPAEEFPTGMLIPRIPTQRAHSDPQDVYAVQALIEEAIGPEPDRVRRMLEMTAEGFSHEEIAKALDDGTTTRGVEGELYRARQRARLRRQER